MFYWRYLFLGLLFTVLTLVIKISIKFSENCPIADIFALVFIFRYPSFNKHRFWRSIFRGGRWIDLVADDPHGKVTAQ